MKAIKTTEIVLMRIAILCENIKENPQRINVFKGLMYSILKNKRQRER